MQTLKIQPAGRMKADMRKLSRNGTDYNSVYVLRLWDPLDPSARRISLQVSRTAALISPLQSRES